LGTKPYLCPVCKGTTVVGEGFYSDEPKRTKCKACVNGIIFGASDELTWTTIPFTSYPSYQPANMFQCGVCGNWYSGTHNCMGKFTYGPGYVSPQTTGSNPPTIPEVAQWLGGDYLNPGTVSEDE